MKAIVAVDENWGIGYKGGLLQRIPEDMKYFKSMTIGKVVVMGRATFDSMPGKEPLKDRINIVLTRKTDFINEKLTICHSLKELFSLLKKYDTEDVYIIGGEDIFTQLLPYCSQALVTKIQNTYMADKYFVNLDREKNWKIESESEIKSYEGVKFSFLKYVNTKTEESK